MTWWRSWLEIFHSKISTDEFIFLKVAATTRSFVSITVEFLLFLFDFFLFGMTTCSTSRWFPPKFFFLTFDGQSPWKSDTLGIRMNVFSQSFQANLHVMDGNALFLADWSNLGRFWIYAGVHLANTLTKGLLRDPQTLKIMSSWWVTRNQHPGAATGGHASRSNGYLEPSVKLRELLKTNSWHMKYPSNLAYSQGKMFVSRRVIKSWGWKKGISPLTHGASASWWDVFSRSVIPKNRTWRNHSLQAMTSQHICHICFIFVSIYKSVYVYLCYYNIWCIIFSWFYKQSMWNLGIYRNEPRISPSKPPKKHPL